MMGLFKSKRNSQIRRFAGSAPESRPLLRSKNTSICFWAVFFVSALALFFSPSFSRAQPVPPGTIGITEDIATTRHNLSSELQTEPIDEDVRATNTEEICIFCHTPHGAAQTSRALEAPLWNRNLDYQGAQAYVLYDEIWSNSFEGALHGSMPTGYSRLCLSCHDDVIAIGSVVNSAGSGGYYGDDPTTDSLGIDVMSSQSRPSGSGILSGDTRVLGVNLQNDHPISFTFDSSLAGQDAELVDPGGAPADLNAVTALAPAGGFKTGVKRYGSTTAPGTFDSVQCTSCHNPHATTYPKFLRAPRLQDAGESGFLPGGLPAADHPPGQIICLYCHAKPGWNNSTHDVSGAIHSEFPADDGGTANYDESGYDFDGLHTVGEYACRNCHDPHTVQGAKRLHREGVDLSGVADAIENTCFLCHSPNTVPNPLLPVTDPTSGARHRFCDQVQAGCPPAPSASRIAPDIYSEFSKDSGACAGGASTGSAMCLQLATGHEPVFISRSQEGVQVKSEGLGGLEVPSTNEEFPGTLTADPTHVECVDCHNPHQVNSPNSASAAYSGVPNPPGGVGSADAQGEGGRFKGMKGVGIESQGLRPIVVGPCEPGFVICGTETTINANHPALATQSSANRDPYVYEICFRCHGMSYKRVFSADGTGIPGLLNPDDVKGITIPAPANLFVADPDLKAWSFRSDPVNGVAASGYSFEGFSNKWLELNPETDDIDSPELFKVDALRFGTTVASHTRQTKNPAYHPVVLPGRNGSWQLCNQLASAFSLDCGAGPGTPVAAPGNPGAAQTALSNLTIQCTDCHNNNTYDAYGGGAVMPVDAFNATFDSASVRGPLTESNLRPTDVWPDLNAVVAYNNRVSQPIGPHGSDRIRLLRANYDTNIFNSTRCFAQGNPAGCAQGDGYAGAGATHAIAGGGAGSNNNHYGKFLLCFNCHDRRAFDPDAVANGDQDTSWTRFFGLNSSAGVDSWWNGNLHMYHLRWTGAMCHECHYNIHSNVQALNTIYGDGAGGLLPPDGMDGMDDGVVGTHLLNFAPTVEGTLDLKPKWFFDGTAFRCYMRCHNEVMNSCAYQNTSTGTPDARWCAGGRNPGTSG